ncbi:phage tail tape measure protein [Pseudomonas sp. TH06]|uniref:phage tail tape measure protein n=1 Tax=Pseudomonas sp. TH06 TaxID=2796372 RepID=UPI001911D316|nr:phage tail tape measure protein [Pseudomonas sp. TH06]MBK5525395.1 phage tail tape measure protein [Pseudomonas sp. TH06]
MAESKYAPMNADERSAAAPGNSRLNVAAASAGTGAIAREQVSSLSQALNTASSKIGSLTAAIDALRLVLSNLRSIPLNTAAKGEAAHEATPPGEASERAKAPESLKPAIDLYSAAAELVSAAQLPPKQTNEMAVSSLIMASAPLVAAGGTSGQELLKVATLAADAWFGNELTNASDKPFELLNFAGDAAVVASAFKVPAMEVAEMMAVWRTSMKLTRDQAFDLADATNQLGKMPGGAKPADIGAVLKQSGDAAITAGLQPEQAAALSAALLNSGTKKDDAGEVLKSISIALDKGGNVSATERGAWKQLGLDPVAVTAAMHDPDKQNAQGAVLSVLAALNAKPAEQRAMLAQTLFADSGNAVQLLSQNLGDVNEAFSQVKDKDQYATSKVGDQSSVRQSALALSNTPQGQWNAQSARSERLAIASANAVSPSPQALSVAGASIDSMSEFAEEHPTTSAVIITVGTALKKIFDVILDAAVDEGKDRLRKRIPGGASATPPDLSSTADSATQLPTDPPVTEIASLAPATAREVEIGEQSLLLNTPRLGPSSVAMGTISQVVPASDGDPGAAMSERLVVIASDTLSAPGQVSKDLASAQASNQHVTFAPSVQVYCSDPGSSENIGLLVTQHLQSQFDNQFTPLMSSNPLGTRRDAALTDGVA